MSPESSSRAFSLKSRTLYKEQTTLTSWPFTFAATLFRRHLAAVRFARLKSNGSQKRSGQVVNWALSAGPSKYTSSLIYEFNFSHPSFREEEYERKKSWKKYPLCFQHSILYWGFHHSLLYDLTRTQLQIGSKYETKISFSHGMNVFTRY